MHSQSLDEHLLDEETHRKQTGIVRGCLLGWYGYDGEGLAGLILRSDDPATKAREVADRLLKLATELEESAV